jgi:predicted SAM-dependent methyltransferase
MLGSNSLTFGELKNKKNINLYLGTLTPKVFSRNIPAYIGISNEVRNSFNIFHDITEKFDLSDNSVDIIQSEDVFEHIEYEKLPSILNELYRILKPNGYLRLSIPDYKCDILTERCEYNENGEIIFDKGGDGNYDYVLKKVINGGHIWFPIYESVKALLDKTQFNYKFLHYYDENGVGVLHDIDHSKGYIDRTPEHDERVSNPRRPMSIVVDCYKSV